MWLPVRRNVTATSPISWNEDASGRLTRDFLIITRPQLRELGPEVIPVHRLINVQFSDGGIKKVESQAAPPK